MNAQDEGGGKKSRNEERGDDEGKRCSTEEGEEATVMK